MYFFLFLFCVLFVIVPLIGERIAALVNLFEDNYKYNNESRSVFFRDLFIPYHLIIRTVMSKVNELEK